MQIARIEFPIARPILVLAFLVFAFAPYAAAPAHASYGMEGTLSLNTEGGSSIVRVIPFAERLEVSDSDTNVGGVGNTATGGYSGSITNVSIGASSTAENALFQPGDYWSSSAFTETFFRDDLRFTIPAGFYPSGVQAVARVHVEGSLSLSGSGATARHTYSFAFGTDSVLVVTDAPAPAISTDIELAAELVVPGTTLNSPVTRLARFNAFVDSWADAAGEVAQTSASTIAGDVTCLVVPPGVTWVSDSGAFGAPDCSAALPGLPGLGAWAATALVLALAGTALWIVGTRRPNLA